MSPYMMNRPFNESKYFTFLKANGQNILCEWLYMPPGDLVSNIGKYENDQLHHSSLSSAMANILVEINNVSTIHGNEKQWQRLLTIIENEITRKIDYYINCLEELTNQIEISELDANLAHDIDHAFDCDEVDPNLPNPMRTELHHPSCSCCCSY